MSAKSDDSVLDQLMEAVTDPMLVQAEALGEHELLQMSPMYLPKIGDPTVFAPHVLAGTTVQLATPVEVRSEDGMQLDVQGAVKARAVELDAMTQVGFGKVVG